jgi:dTDP-4-dehydrorhamnose 3,5-epimerase
MKILELKTLAIPEIKVLRFGRFSDARGYFTETYRKTDFDSITECSSLQRSTFVQCSESYSKAGTIRGLHFQWNPYMGKLVRTLLGHMVDLVLDIRLGSPTCGQIIAYDMPADPAAAFAEWIWVPPGFAHGNFFTENSQIEYLCAGIYSQGCESAISPLAQDIDWSLCHPELKSQFDRLKKQGPIMTDKDRDAASVAAWKVDPRAENFQFGKL